MILVNLKKKLFLTYEKEWLGQINQLPKLRLYQSIKTNFKTENFLEMNISKSQRSIMAQFRCGILPIRIETGRYKGGPVDERICNFCELNEIEDDSHFLLNCAMYSDFRRVFLIISDIIQY